MALRAGGVPRKKDFKKGTDADDARRKREDNIIELRKNKRDENLQKKRLVHAGPSYAMEDGNRMTQQAMQHKVGLERAGGGCIMSEPAPALRASWRAPLSRPAATGRAAEHGQGCLQHHASGPVRGDAEVPQAALHRWGVRPLDWHSTQHAACMQRAIGAIRAPSLCCCLSFQACSWYACLPQPFPLLLDPGACRRFRRAPA